MLFEQYKDLCQHEVQNKKFVIHPTMGTSQNNDMLHSNIT